MIGLDLANMQGDYDAYVQTVKETRLAQQRAYDAQQKEISHILEFINKHDERPKIVAQKAGNCLACAILATILAYPSCHACGAPRAIMLSRDCGPRPASKRC